MLEQFLKKASKAYYEGTPIITDEEFDELSRIIDFNSIGYSSDFKWSHYEPMYSLQKVYRGERDPRIKGLVCTPKLDGAAISIRYSDTNLVMAITRGDGKKGINITDKVKLLVPNKIGQAGEVQVTGEVVCPKDTPNARNLASGSLGLKDLEEFSRRPLTFIAYDVTPKIYDNWSDDMTRLRYEGFNTVLDSDWEEFPQDGKVFRLNNNKEYESLGFTAHHPRGAYALKERKEGVVTTLLDVVWKVGKSGVVSPIAILAPVNIDGALVSKATLHNISYIKALGLEIGCAVEVIRSGEIIPRVVRRID